MAEDGSLTPEKQLLRLIEGGSAAAGGSRASAGGPPPSAPLKKSGLSFGALGGLFRGRLSFFKRSSKKNVQAARENFHFSLPLLNRTLVAACAALFLFLVYDAATRATVLSRPIHLPGEKTAAVSTGTGRVSPLSEASFYLEKVSTRDIFREGDKPKKKEAREAPVPAQENAAISALSLVGISWSANPDVIIEDKEAKRTYFVKRGQFIGEKFKVEAIFKDHVVLSLDGQEFELR